VVCGRQNAYVTLMRLLIALFAAYAALSPVMARAQSDAGRYDIMRPEPGHPEELPTPWLPPKYRSPRGSHNRVEPVRPAPSPRTHEAVTPPPVYVPRTGRYVPSAPVLSPSGPNGTETFQDRATRCVGQSSSVGAGKPNTYVGTCVNQ